MKRKIALIALMLALATVLAVLFVFSTSAAEEEIVVKYAWFDGSKRKEMTPNEDGSYTLRTEKLSNNGTVTLADGTVVDKVFYGWFTQDGTLYEPGATVTFTESTNLYEAYGIEVDNEEDLNAVKTNMYIRIGADFTSQYDLYSSWGTTICDLNGHTLTITHKNQAIYNYRGACAVIGKGKIIHAPSTLNTNDGQASGIAYEHHGYGDRGNPQLCWIGKDVEFVTPYNFIRTTKTPNHEDMPNVEIYGKITAKNFIRAGVLTNSTINFHPSADVTLTGTKFFDCTNETGVSKYMNLSLNGKIKFTDTSATMFSDFLMSNKFTLSQVTSGEYTISSSDAERMSTLLPSTLMLKETYNDDGTVTYAVVESDCAHEWEYDPFLSIEALPGQTGIEAYYCPKCGRSSKTVIAYSPKDVKINVVVRTENGDKAYTVLAGDVLDLQNSGYGANTICCIMGLKDTEDFTASQIVAFDIPVGVAEFTGFANETVEQINIADGVDITISILSQMKALKTINIGAATVEFQKVTTSSIETISSNVPGASINFVSSCFDGVGSIKNLNLSKGSSYRFEANCFRNTKLQKVILPDDSSINFAGDAAFYGCPELTYVYFGKNCIADKKIIRKPFDCCYSLQTVVLMDIVFIDQYVFCCNGNATSNASHREGKGLNTGALNVYSHSDTLSLNANAFANRTVLGVNLYTLAEVTKLSNCAYTIYVGLPHAYSLETVEEPTCIQNGVAEYVTACPCGEDYRTNTCVTYSTLDETINGVEFEGCGTLVVDIPMLDTHTDSDIINNIIYANGYLSLGTKTYKCLYCDETIKTEETPSAEALFICKGYSASKIGNGISLGFDVNNEAIAIYTEATGKTFKYGVFAGAQAVLGTSDIFDEGVNGKTFTADIEKADYTGFDVKVVGLVTDTQKSAKLALGVYVAITNEDTTEYTYIQVDAPTEGEKYSFVSYNDIVTPVE